MRDEGALADARFAWRGEVTDEELVTLTQSYGGMSELGDGGDYAFLIDTKVRPDHQRRGIGTELLRISAGCAKEAGVRVVGGCGR